MASGRRTLVPPFMSLLLALVAVLAGATEPNREAGIPYMTTWEPPEYGGAAQNWGVALDEHDLVYVANGLGVMQFDGANWRWLDETRNLTARSLDTGPGGMIYVGYHNEIGQFTPTVNEGFRYTDLTPAIPDSLRDFRDVWITHVAGQHVYFSSYSAVFRARIDSAGVVAGSWTCWPAGDSGHYQAINSVENEVYAIHTGNGLLRVDGENLVSMPNAPSDSLYHVWSILPWPGDRLLLVGYNGMHLYGGAGLKRFDTPVSRFAAEHGGYNATALGDGRFALGMENTGVLLFDQHGDILRRVDVEMGLADNAVHNYPYPDRNGGVWLAHDYGISRVELTSPYHRYTRSLGLRGGATSLARHHGTLYAATPEGLAWLNPAETPGDMARFRYVNGIDMAWDLARCNGHVIAATDYGVYGVASGESEPEPLLPKVGGYCITADTVKQRAFVGDHYGGVHSVSYQDGRWVDEGEIANLGSNVLWIDWDPRGNVWLSYGFNEAYWARLVIQETEGGGVEVVRIDRFDKDSGYEKAAHGHPFTFDGEFYLPCWYELYRYDPAADRLHAVPDDHPLHRFTVDNSINMPANGPDGSLWFQDDWGMLQRVRPAEGDSVTVDQPMDRYFTGGFGYLLPEEDTFWAASAGVEVLQLELTSSIPLQPLPRALIREVRIGADSLLYLGRGDSLETAFELEPGQQDLYVKYTLPSYHESGRHQYQIRVIGAMEEWSSWGPSTHTQITQLDPGSYHFAVRARDASGRVTEASMMGFVVLPPWYETTWAMILWGLLALLVGYAVVAWRIRAVQRRAQVLDELVTTRTEELHTARATEREAEIKANHTEKLAATIAHEFNNPLAIIHAAAQLMNTGEHDMETMKAFAGKIPPQVRRMDNLLQQLRKLKEFREVDYAAGMTIIDLHDRPLRISPPSESGVGPDTSDPASTPPHPRPKDRTSRS